jgi:hypothetical protein
MQFRLWLEEIEKVLNVGLTQWNSDNPKRHVFPYKIYKNPSKQELLDTFVVAKELRDFENGQLQVVSPSGQPHVLVARGFLSSKGDIFIWPEIAATHQDVGDVLGEHIQITFYIDSNFHTTTWMNDAIRILGDNPNYKKMMGKKPDSQEYKGPTWYDALKKKVLPGSVQKLPYE